MKLLNLFRSKCLIITQFDQHDVKNDLFCVLNHKYMIHVKNFVFPSF